MSVYPACPLKQTAGNPSLHNAPITLQPLAPLRLPPQQQQQQQQPQLPHTIGGETGSVEDRYSNGLVALNECPSLVIKQQKELLEILCGCETQNKYKILTAQGLQIFSVMEDTDCCTRQCCGNIRPFEMEIRDKRSTQVIHLSRPLACGTYLFPCCLQSIQVFCPPGEYAGSVEELWGCTPTFLIRDKDNQVALRVVGPQCGYNCACCTVEFSIFDPEGEKRLGLIVKRWGGILKEMFTDADCFGITFPVGLDVKLKAVLIGALFLIDFIFFERANNSAFDYFN